MPPEDSGSESTHAAGSPRETDPRVRRSIAVALAVIALCALAPAVVRFVRPEGETSPPGRAAPSALAEATPARTDSQARASDPVTQTSAAPTPASHVAISVPSDRADVERERELATLRGALAELRGELRQLRAAAQRIDAAAGEARADLDAQRRAVADLRRALDRRPTAAPASQVPASAPSAPDLSPFEQRLLHLEQAMQTEGKARIAFQESLLERVFNLETSRDAVDAELIAAHRALLERLYNSEQRIEASESRQQALESRFDALPAR